MCAEICASPEDVAMTCDDCKSGIQASIKSFGEIIGKNKLFKTL